MKTTSSITLHTLTFLTLLLSPLRSTAQDFLAEKIQRVTRGQSLTEASAILGTEGREVRRYAFVTSRWNFPDGSELSIDFCGGLRCGAIITKDGKAARETLQTLSGAGSKTDMTSIAAMIGGSGKKGEPHERVEYEWGFGTDGVVFAVFEDGKLKEVHRAMP